MKKTALAALLIMLAALAPQPAPADTPFDLTGYWETGNIGTFYIRQINDELFWYAEDDPIAPTWANIAHGKVQDKTVFLDWIDIPKGTAYSKGTLVIEIKYPDRLVLVKQTGGWGGGKEWTRSRTDPEI
ncbi:MAG: hypothetical protein RDV48_25130 [Candidatus Eremiobacteraeota bacterium]|nr:hypothetical protein [Candidatus Eremiobacteraeota bacterium]